MRRSPAQVLELESDGPSPRGSTYWTRALHCPREHLLANKLGWRSLMSSDPLDTGLIWHYCLEVYYLARQAAQGAMLAAWGLNAQADGYPKIADIAFFQVGEADGQKAAFTALQRFAGEPGYQKIYEKLSRMLDVYFDRYRLDRWQVVAVEPTIMILEDHPAYCGFEYSSRLDLIIVDHQLATPCLRTVEHKSSYSLDIKVTEGYTQDLQVLGQVWVVVKGVDLAAYPPYVGSIVNITSKTKTPGLARVPVQPMGDKLLRFEQAMQTYDKRVLPLYEETGYPQNFAACSRKYGRCEFFDVCRQRPELVTADLLALTELPGYEKTDMMEIKR